MERLRSLLRSPLVQRLAWTTREREGKPREDPQLLARFACYLFAAGATLIVVTLALPSHPDQHNGGLVGLAVLSYLASAAVWLAFDRLGLRAFQALAALGTLVITFALYFRVDAQGPYLLFYVWPILFSFFFFRRRAAFVQLALVAVAYGLLGALGHTGEYAALYWLMLVSSLAVAGVLVSLVTDQLERMWERRAETEGRFGRLVTNIPGAVYRCALDEDWTMEFVSDSIEEISGYPASDFIGNQVRSYASIIHRDDAGMGPVKEALASGRPFTLEYRIIHRDGSLRWVHERGQATQTDGKTTLDGAIFDVTERRRVEEELRDAEAGYRMLVEQLPLATYIDAVDETSSNIYSSPQTEELFGYSPEEWRADRELFPKLLHKDDRERVLREHAHCHATGEPLRTEYRLTTRDGRVVWVQDEAVLVADAEGRPRYLQGFLLDITARKEAEVARNRLASIVESSDDAMFSASTEGEIESWNRGAERMYGYLADEIVGESVARLIPPERQGEMMQILERITRGEAVHFETVRIRKDGSPMDVALTVSPITDGAGTVIGASGIQRDVTERKRAEKALAEQNERLREVDRMKDEFVALVSHELRTPLTSIRGYVQLLLGGRAGPVAETQQRFLEVVGRNSERLLRLVSDLLFFTQSASQKLSLEPEPLELAELLQDSIEAAKPVADGKRISLWLAADELPPVTADRARLGQVLDNLLSNALKFTPDGGRVEVAATAVNSHVTVSVSDSGIGISEADRDSIFDRFFRSATAGELAIPGTGLGLAVAKAITEAHGGTISCESEPGQGSTFRVELPLPGRQNGRE